MHRSLGWDMLHNTIIGPEPISHPYFEAFHKGLMMASAGDQTIAQFAHAFVGGPEKFVASTYACYIRSYDSLRLEYQIELEEAAVTNLEALITSQPTLKATNFIGVIREFLEGQGAPYSQLLQEVKERFHSLVDLDEISQKSFRMRMFNWAVTGTPHVLQDGPAITIRLVEDNDVEYLSGVPLARQPAYIGLGREYSSEPEADNAAKAVHHWLLVSILDNVGENNVA
ncbi:hypothetical protein MPER_11325 [Moniliophthora perniciosa FA553]|nr:hypothetical protein MPER_11325 [Moniliophthora perniciosa FA553]